MKSVMISRFDFLKLEDTIYNCLPHIKTTHSETLPN